MRWDNRSSKLGSRKQHHKLRTSNEQKSRWPSAFQDDHLKCQKSINIGCSTFRWAYQTSKLLLCTSRPTLATGCQAAWRMPGVAPPCESLAPLWEMPSAPGTTQRPPGCHQLVAERIFSSMTWWCHGPMCLFQWWLRVPATTVARIHRIKFLNILDHKMGCTPGTLKLATTSSLQLPLMVLIGFPVGEISMSWTRQNLTVESRYSASLTSTILP